MTAPPERRRAGLVSVIMPTYNHARFIGKAVESVLGQSYPDLELIVVDNHSKDATEEIVRSFGDARVKYVKFFNNGVIAASRNHGLRLAGGEFSAFIDSDDLWLPAKLEKQAAALGSDPGAAMVYSRYRTIAGETVSGPVLPKDGRCPGGEIFRDIYLRHFIACSGVLVRREVLDRTGFFDEAPALTAAEDTDLWLRVAAEGRILCASEEPLFLYRVHAGNASGGRWKRYLLDLALARRYRAKAGFAAFGAAALLMSASFLKRTAADFVNKAGAREPR